MTNGNLSAVYGIIAALSVLLCLSYLLWDKKRTPLFLALFGCVAASNCGYFLLAVCNSLTVAKFANALSYFGGAFSMLMMFLIIFNVCQMRKRRWMLACLICISTAVFALAASGDWLGLYYRSVSLENVNGMSRLIKEYGPLHNLYAVYLASYVAGMLLTIAYAAKTKRLSSFIYTLFLLVAVLLNVFVWLIEQVIAEEFELLSVSYIITAVLLLLIYHLLCDYGIIQPETGVLRAQLLTGLQAHQLKSGALPTGMEDLFHGFAEKVNTLSAAERRILNYYIDGHETADIPELAFISIHTVKKHNRSIYQKLEIASRDELMLYIELFRRCGRLEELTGVQAETE